MADPQHPVKPPVKTRVRSLALGYYGGQLRARGEEFEIQADADLGAWMQPISKADADRLAEQMNKTKAIRPPPPVGPGVKPTPATRFK